MKDRTSFFAAAGWASLLVPLLVVGLFCGGLLPGRGAMRAVPWACAASFLAGLAGLWGVRAGGPLRVLTLALAGMAASAAVGAIAYLLSGLPTP